MGKSSSFLRRAITAIAASSLVLANAPYSNMWTLPSVDLKEDHMVGYHPTCRKTRDKAWVGHRAKALASRRKHNKMAKQARKAQRRK